MSAINIVDFTLERLGADKHLQKALEEVALYAQQMEEGSRKRGAIKLSLKIAFEPQGEQFAVNASSSVAKPDCVASQGATVFMRAGRFVTIDAEQPELPNIRTRISAVGTPEGKE